MSKDIDDGGAAFPDSMGEPGMTRRDWLAGQVYPTVLGRMQFPMEPSAFNEKLEKCARITYEAVDALIAAGKSPLPDGEVNP